MFSERLILISLTCLAAVVNSLPTSLMEDVKKADQAMRPKAKRAQETLMFGNQQNRPAEATGNSYVPNAEKRTVNPSGLDNLKAAFAENDKFVRAKPPSNALYDREGYSPYEKNYEYGKVLVNELGEEMPRVWEVPPYQRYHMNDDRRKRSDKSSGTVRTTTVQPTTSVFPLTTPTQQSVQAQMKRSIPVYPEPRYKRELDVNPQDVVTLLQLWENQRRNRNWRNYGNDEYENMEDESEMMEEEEEPRNAGSWLDGSVYPSHRYAIDTVRLPSSDIGIPLTHPAGYYDQYGSQYGQQYEGPVQYGTAQYGALYPQHVYYPPEKRFMMSKKRSQGFDPYSGLAQVQYDSQARGYPYQRHMVY